MRNSIQAKESMLGWNIILLLCVIQIKDVVISPGRTQTTKEANRSYDTRCKCVECSIQFGKDHYFCNDFSLGITRNYHDLYHKKYHGKTIIDT